MKTLWLGALAALLVVAGCGDDDDDKGTSPPVQNGPGAYQSDFRTSASFYTRMSGMKQGSSPHGSVQIWYSSNAREMVGVTGREVPEGTVSVKTFDNDGEAGIDGIAVMIKKAAGYDPANNDWYYEMRDPTGSLMSEPPPGRIGMCISCHAACESKDYLCGTALR